MGAAFQPPLQNGIAADLEGPERGWKPVDLTRAVSTKCQSVAFGIGRFKTGTRRRRSGEANEVRIREATRRMGRIERLDRPNSGAELGGSHEHRVVGREGNVRENVLQVFRKAQGVALRGEQAEDRVEHLIGRDGHAVGAREARQQRARDVGARGGRPPVVQGKGIAAIAAAEGVIVGQQTVAPDGRACACSARERVKSNVVGTPSALHLWSRTVEETEVIVK
jgi:hypothetical protein